jgi:hypothetical protein
VRGLLLQKQVVVTHNARKQAARYYMIKTELAVSAIGGVCAGAALGVIYAGGFSEDWVANIIGAGLAAALSIWGAFAVAARQATETEREFERFAVEVVSNIRDEAEYASLLIVHSEGVADEKERTRKQLRAVFQLRRLLTAVEVFEKHVSETTAGTFKVRLAALNMDKAITEARGYMSKQAEKRLQSGNTDESGKVWGGAARLQTGAQGFLGEVGVNSKFLSDEMRKKREEELDQDIWTAGFDL